MKRMLSARLDEHTIVLLDAWAELLASSNGRQPSRAKAVEFLAASVAPPDDLGEAQRRIRVAHKELRATLDRREAIRRKRRELEELIR